MILVYKILFYGVDNPEFSYNSSENFYELQLQFERYIIIFYDNGTWEQWLEVPAFNI